MIAPAMPPISYLSLSALARLGIAGALSALLWLAVAWSLGWMG
jgi:hypothetical protein